MLLNFQIAKRYLFGKKTTNAINIISGISVFGITLGTAALIIILSVFNGFESLLSNMFNAFNPDLKVSPIQGKRFSIEPDDMATLLEIPGIEAISKTIEEIALFEYRDQQQIGIIKGVDEHFLDVTQIDTTILSGKYSLESGRSFFGVFGLEIASKLTLNTSDKLTEVKVYMPLQKNILPGSREFKIRNLYPSGVYSVKNSDEYQYVICSYDLVNNLLQTKDKNSYLEIKMTADADESEIKFKISNVLGENFIVENKFEQEKTYLKIIQVEKWVSYLIASLTILLIVFNLIGSLWMIVLDKKKDLSVLKSLGQTNGDTRNIVLSLGCIICLIGIVVGIVLAFLLYYIQTSLGMIQVPDGLMIDSYPVKMKLMDIVVVAITVFLLGFCASLIPALRAAKIPAFLREE